MADETEVAFDVSALDDIFSEFFAENENWPDFNEGDDDVTEISSDVPTSTVESESYAATASMMVPGTRQSKQVEHDIGSLDSLMALCDSIKVPEAFACSAPEHNDSSPPKLRQKVLVKENGDDDAPPPIPPRFSASYVPVVSSRPPPIPQRKSIPCQQAEYSNAAAIKANSVPPLLPRPSNLVKKQYGSGRKSPVTNDMDSSGDELSYNTRPRIPRRRSHETNHHHRIRKTAPTTGRPSNASTKSSTEASHSKPSLYDEDEEDDRPARCAMESPYAMSTLMMGDSYLRASSLPSVSGGEVFYASSGAIASSDNAEPWMPSYDDDVARCSFYHGSISRAQAEALLLSPCWGHGNGAFIVRDSSTSPRDHVISVRVNARVVDHYLLSQLRGCVYRASSIGDAGEFSTISALIQHSLEHPYQFLPLAYPVNRQASNGYETLRDAVCVLNGGSNFQSGEPAEKDVQQPPPQPLLVSELPGSGIVGDDHICLARALYTYHVREPGDLGFVAGEVLSVLDDRNDEWWTARNGLGVAGHVPAVLMQRLDVDDSGKQRLNAVDSASSVADLAALDSGTAMKPMGPELTACRVDVRTFDLAGIKGGLLLVREEMFESPFALLIPILLLQRWIEEDRAYITHLQRLAVGVSSSNVGSVMRTAPWDTLVREQLSDRVQIIAGYQSHLGALAVNRAGITFKRSRDKKQAGLLFVATNLHTQRMIISEQADAVSRRLLPLLDFSLNDQRIRRRGFGVHDTCTFGAPTAHTLGYRRHGGLWRMMPHLLSCDPRGTVYHTLRVTLSRLTSVDDWAARPVDSSEACSCGLLAQSKAVIATLRCPVAIPAAAASIAEALASGSLDELDSGSTKGTSEGSVDSSGSYSRKNPRHRLAQRRSVGDVSNEEPAERVMKARAMANALESAVNAVEAARGGSESELLVVNEALQARCVAVNRETLTLLTKALLLAERRVGVALADWWPRLDAVTSQIVTALITALHARIMCTPPGHPWWDQLLHVGLLVGFESLLSTTGDELGMLEDMLAAVDSLNRVTIGFISGVVAGQGEDHDGEPLPPVVIGGCRGALHIQLRVDRSIVEALPSAFRTNHSINICPVIFTQGINEQQTIANTLGSAGLQDETNIVNFKHLEDYYERYCSFYTGVDTHTAILVALDAALARIETVLRARKAKNVELLQQTAAVTRLLDGLRFTSCKSAKDRTGMSVTLEQHQILAEAYGLTNARQYVIDRFRRDGTRLVNVEKNTGARFYAFKGIQVRTLPSLYRPCEGTFGDNSHD